MRKIILLIFTIVPISCLGQKIESVRKPLPESVLEHVPLPERMRIALEEKEREKKNKTYTVGNYSSLGANLRDDFSSYFIEGDDRIYIKYSDGYRYVTPQLNIANSSLLQLSPQKLEKIKGKKSQRKPKKFSNRDDISCAYITAGNKIMVVKSNGTPCVMSEFDFLSNNDLIKVEGNQITLPNDIRELFKRDNQVVYKILATHKPSGRSFVYIIHAKALSEIKIGDHVNSLAIKHDDVLKDNYALLYNFKEKIICVVRLPFVVNAKGENGRNGQNGMPGLIGINKMTFTNSKGQTTTIAGTCGTSGGDGGPGGDGGNGGFIIVAYDALLFEKDKLNSITVYADRGLGGKGGRGGAPGRHGVGAACFVPLHRGLDGPDGKDGKDGDYLYLIMELENLKTPIVKSN